MTKVKRLLFLILVTLFPLLSFSQTLSSWTEVGCDINLPKGFEIEASVEVRNEFNNGLFIEQYFPQLGLNYKLNSFTDIAVNYRFIQQRESNNYFYNRIKYFVDLGNDVAFNRFKIKNRVRYSILYKNYMDSEFDHLANTYLRDKVEVAYDIKKKPIEPFVSYEIFYPLNGYTPNYIDEYRLSVGAKIPLRKKESLKVAFMYTNELASRLGKAYILSLSYSFSVKPKIFKKSKAETE